jgi:hypothetical protein
MISSGISDVHVCWNSLILQTSFGFDNIISKYSRIKPTFKVKVGYELFYSL